MKKWINGTRGAISLLLAMLMLPFFSLAAVLVEAERYQSAVKALDGVLGSSSISALANYDGYLKDRFGLLAVSQDEDPAATAAFYLNHTRLTDLAAVSLSDVTVTGMYPLSNTSVLRRQVMEYSKLLVPARVVTDGLQIDEIIKKLENATQLSPLLETIFSSCNAVGAEADCLEALAATQKAASATQRDIQSYQTAFSTWQASVTKLADHLDSDSPSAESDPDGADSWSNTADDLTGAAEQARADYLAAIVKLISSLDNLQKKVDKAISAETAMESSFYTLSVTATANAATMENNASSAATTNEDLKEALKNSSKINSALSAAVTTEQKSYLSDVKQCLDSFDNQELLQASHALQEDQTAVQNYKTAHISGSTSAPTQHEYHTAAVNDLVDADTLSRLLNSTTEEVLGSGVEDFFTSLLAIVNSLFKTETLFDASLNSKLDLDFYQSRYGGLPSAKPQGTPSNAQQSGNPADEQRSKDYLAAIYPDYDANDPYGTGTAFAVSMLENIANDLTVVMTSANTLKDNFGRLSKLVDFLSALKDFAVGVASLITHTLLFLNQVVAQVALLLSGAAYERLLLNGYLAYNLPNRTTYRTGITLTGYKFTNIPYGAIPDQQLSQIPGIGTLAALGSAIANGGGHPNKTFSGAELEYVVWGFNSEIGNQSMQFIALYLLRLLLDLPTLLTNQEVNTYVAASGPLSPLILAIYIFCEPLADTLILVNRGEIPLIKRTPYLTVEGLPKLVEKFTSLPLTRDLSEKIKQHAATFTGPTNHSSFGSAPSSPGSISLDKNHETSGSISLDKNNQTSGKTPTDILPLNYTEYSLLVMMVIASEDTYLRRLSDLIQCESSAYRERTVSLSNRAAGTFKDFNVDESFTAVRTSAAGSLVQLLPVPALSSSSVFPVDRIIYRGY